MKEVVVYFVVIFFKKFVFPVTFIFMTCHFMFFGNVVIVIMPGIAFLFFIFKSLISHVSEINYEIQQFILLYFCKGFGKFSEKRGMKNRIILILSRKF